MGKWAYHFIKLVHLRENRELFPSFENFSVLSSMRLLREWVDIMFLSGMCQHHTKKKESR